MTNEQRTTKQKNNKYEVEDVDRIDERIAPSHRILEPISRIL